MENSELFVSPAVVLSFSELDVNRVNNEKRKSLPRRKRPRNECEVKRTSAELNFVDFNPTFAPVPSASSQKNRNLLPEIKNNSIDMRSHKSSTKKRGFLKILPKSVNTQSSTFFPKPQVSNRLPTHDSEYKFPTNHSIGNTDKSGFGDPKTAVDRVKQRLIAPKSLGQTVKPQRSAVDVEPMRLEALPIRPKTTSTVSVTGSKDLQAVDSSIEEVLSIATDSENSFLLHDCSGCESIEVGEEPLKIHWKKPKLDMSDTSIFEPTKIPMPEFNKELLAYNQRKNKQVVNFKHSLDHYVKEFPKNNQKRKISRSKLRQPKKYHNTSNGVYECAIVLNTMWITRSFVDPQSTEITRIPRPDYTLLKHYRIRRYRKHQETVR